MKDSSEACLHLNSTGLTHLRRSRFLYYTQANNDERLCLVVVVVQLSLNWMGLLLSLRAYLSTPLLLSFYHFHWQKEALHCRLGRQTIGFVVVGVVTLCFKRWLLVCAWIKIYIYTQHCNSLKLFCWQKGSITRGYCCPLKQKNLL